MLDWQARATNIALIVSGCNLRASARCVKTWRAPARGRPRCSRVKVAR